MMEKSKVTVFYLVLVFFFTIAYRRPGD